MPVVVLQFLDVSRAHLTSECSFPRDWCTPKLPKQTGSGPVAVLATHEMLVTGDFEFAVRDEFEVNNFPLERTHRAVTDARQDGCGTSCTATTTWDWEHVDLSGTDKK